MKNTYIIVFVTSGVFGNDELFDKGDRRNPINCCMHNLFIVSSTGRADTRITVFPLFKSYTTEKVGPDSSCKSPFNRY